MNTLSKVLTAATVDIVEIPLFAAPEGLGLLVFLFDFVRVGLLLFEFLVISN